MCGASDDQRALEKDQRDFYEEGIANARTTFTESQAIQQQFQSIYSPILAAGPNQEGYSAAEKENLNAQATEGTAENYKGASRALNEKMAAEGGGNIPLNSGQQTQLRAELAASSAATQSNEENQIQAGSYATGRQNWLAAGNALNGAMNELNPTGYANAAVGEGNSAAEMANKINSESSSNFWAGAFGEAEATSPGPPGSSKGSAPQYSPGS